MTITAYFKKALLLGCILQGILTAGPAAPKPVSALTQEADLVLIATLQGVTVDGGGSIDAQLSPIQILKGSESTSPIQAVLASTQSKAEQGSLVQAGQDKSPRLWFLRRQAGGPAYLILPLAEGDSSWSDASLKIDMSDWPLNQGTLQQQAVQALVASYRRGEAGANRITELSVLVNLQYADRDLALSLAAALMGSPVKRHHVLGLAASLSLGSDEAVRLLASEIGQLQLDPSFAMITDAIKLSFTPQGLPSIRALQDLVSQRSDAPGLDDAIASALARVNSKAVLPVMALLLDSRNPTAQLRAASFFARFALFADAGGNISASNEVGPFSTDATKAATPRSDSEKRPSDYASFWRTWWAENQNKVGLK